MATTTQYGGAPLPELAARADALDALRRTGGGLADQQRRTQRAALGGALTFCFAGFAVLALTASPTYGPWNESPDAMETSGGVAARATLGPDDALARASSSSSPAPSSFARPAAAASFAARAEPRLGQVDSQAVFEALLDAVTEAERAHLLQLRDGAQVMPDVIFQKFAELAASVAANEDGARATHIDKLVQKLNILTDMDVTTAHLILHFRQNADVAEEEKLEPADLAGFGTTVLAILRKYPEWSAEDARVIVRATQRAARAQMNQNATARAKTKADLGSVSGSGSRRPIRGLASSRDARRGIPGALNGIAPATRSRALPLSEFASAPGLRRSVPTLGRSVTHGGGLRVRIRRRRRRRLDSRVVRSRVRQSAALVRRARGVPEVRGSDRNGARPGQVRIVLGGRDGGGDERSTLRRVARRGDARTQPAVPAVVLRLRERMRRRGRGENHGRGGGARRALTEACSRARRDRACRTSLNPASTRAKSRASRPRRAPRRARTDPSSTWSSRRRARTRARAGTGRASRGKS